MEGENRLVLLGSVFGDNFGLVFVILLLNILYSHTSKIYWEIKLKVCSKMFIKSYKLFIVITFQEFLEEPSNISLVLNDYKQKISKI